MNNLIRFGAFLLMCVTVASAGDTPLGPVEEFVVTTDGATFNVRVQSPPAERLSAHPRLLIFLSGDRQSAMPDGKYGAPTKAFLDKGNRIVSFDLPAHGERVDRHASGIAGLAALVAAGKKPFDAVVAEGRAVIDECLRRGLAEKDGIYVAGVSRGGYCALRLAAADERISAAAALAPVTDWRVVDEFAAQKGSSLVADLALTNYAASLAGRRIYVAIGNYDLRVGTDACTRFVLAISEHERLRHVKSSALRFLVVDDSAGHSLASKWRTEAMAFLLDTPEVSARGSMP